MKKLIPLLFLSMLCIIMSCSSQNNTKRKTHPFPGLTNGEDTLYTSANMISQGTGVTYMSWEDSCLSMSAPIGITSLRCFDESIDTLALDSLHTIAAALTQQGSHYITALQVIFGINPNTYHFMLFFKPIALGRATFTPSQSVATYTVTQSSQASNTYFTFDTISHHLISASPGYLNSAVDTFKKYIQISQTITHHAPGGFNPRQDSMGSATSVIFSFQQLFNYILQDDSAAKASGHPFHSLNIYNTCVKYPVVVGTAKDTLIKEDLMFGINNCTIYDDLGHLCPPDCEAIIYPVYITQ